MNIIINQDENRLLQTVCPNYAVFFLRMGNTACDTIKVYTLNAYTLLLGATAIFISVENIDPAVGWMRLIIHGGRVNKAYNKCLFTRLPGK